MSQWDDPGGRPKPPPPPSRPRFEFREPPSQVEVRRPAIIGISYALWMIAAAAAVGSALVLMFDLAGLEASLQAVVDRDFPNEAPGTRDRVVSVAAATLIGTGILVGLGQAAAARGLGAGRGWTRFLLVVLTSLAVLDAVLTVDVAPQVSRILLALSVAFAVVASVLMYLPEANRWLAAQLR